MWDRIRQYRARWFILILISLAGGFFIYKAWIRPYAIFKKNSESVEWKFKANHFNKLKHHGKHVFFGNSLTAGLGAYLSGNASVSVCGINGDFTGSLLRRMDTILNQQPGSIYIEIGINDILAGLSEKKILRNYRNIIKKALRYLPPEHIILQSILPVSFKEGWMSDPDEANRIICSVNEGIRTLCGEYKVIFIDLHRIFKRDGRLAEELTSDGVHLTDKGYLLWLQQLTSFLPAR
ncbi:MAG: hypothetical protein IT233_10425 [Bacteroidia bacterium]|nr:hypothetical protein [Bacteroidia bacterium]